MKLYLNIFLIISLFFISCNNSSNTENSSDISLEKIKSNGKIVLGLDDTFAPMGFRSTNGDIVGFDIDLAKEVASRMGVELEIRPIDWSSAILALNKGDVDVLWNGLTISESRKKQISFSKPYIKNKLVLVKLSNRDDLNKKEDFKGKVIGVQVGANADTLDKDELSKISKEIRKYDVNVNAFLDLSAKRIDALAIDSIACEYYINQNHNNFEILSYIELSEEFYGIGFRKNDTAFLDEVNRILDEMRADGIASKISEKWFGSDIMVK